MTGENIEREDGDVGPFGIPISMKSWVVMQLIGFAVAFPVMGLVYAVTESSLYGPISVSEAVGFVFLVVWVFGMFGPFSPLRVRSVRNDQ